jgi:Protein of unknown function (DUF2721)
MQRALPEIIPYLQTAIGPVILISGVGMLLLVMTNRFGRAVDRTRLLVAELRKTTATDANEAGEVRAQIRILFRRARVLRWAIGLASASVLWAALLIVTIFVSALVGLGAVGPVEAQFIGSLLCLIVAVSLFLYDIHLSLVALRMELRGSGVV